MTQFTNTNTQSNIDAPATPDTTPDTTADTTADTAAADIITARNDYRWTPACQRAFLEELACSGSVKAACAHVAKSPRAAYGLRFRRDGAALALGWDAAILIARAVVEDTLMDRVLNGWEEVSIQQDDGRRVRQKQDNRLGLGLLARLDRMAEGQAVANSHQAQVQLVRQDFEAYLDLIGSGGTGAAAALFCAARGADDAHVAADEEYGIERELDRICDAEAEKAYATGQRQAMLDMDPDKAAQRLEVWYDDFAKSWKTNFPAYGSEDDVEDILDSWDDTEQSAFFGDEDYERALTHEELSAHIAALNAMRKPWIDAGIAARNAWFGGNAGSGAGAGAGMAKTA
jgi:hypothetical protein